MKKAVAVLLGAASFAPAACAAIYAPAWMISGGPAKLSTAEIVCWAVLWLAFVVVTGYFIIKVLTAKGMDPLLQLLWFMALLSVPPIATPIYWWQYFRLRALS